MQPLAQILNLHSGQLALCGGMYTAQIPIEEARETIDCEMKKRNVEYLFEETSARTGQNLDEFKKQFGMF